MTETEPSATVQRLRDIGSLRELCLMYARAFERHELDLYRAVFVEDVVLEFHDFEDGRLEGLAAFLDSMREPPPYRTQQFIGNYEFELEGDRATGRLYAHAHHWRADSPGNLYSVGARYHDDYARLAEGWRITERHAHVMWTDGDPSILDGTHE